ncbi:coiled-coil domain-containing protein mad1 [Basidiobolus ranarum]|uniref:Spindle assembly checkpoint component MAD1 n=1 Tax=Basidiobolus ranarum TaxID=34480 RepID=A0ABR2VYG3_9FUNG
MQNPFNTSQFAKSNTKPFSETLRSSRLSTNNRSRPIPEISSGYNKYISELEASPPLKRRLFSENELGYLSSTQTPRNSFKETADPELSEVKRKASDLKYELSKTRTEYDRKVIGLESLNRELQSQVKEQALKIEKLEKDRRFLFEREKLTSENIVNLETENKKLTRDNERLKRQLEDENSDLREQLDSLREEKEYSESGSNQKINLLKSQARGLENKVNSLEEQLRHESELASSRMKKLGQVQEELEEAEKTNRDLRSKLSQSGTNETINQELHRQVSYLKNLEAKNSSLLRENKSLKENQQNIAILKEEKSSLESKLSMMDSLRDRSSELEVELSVLKREKAQWSTFLDKKDNSEFDSPYSLSKTVASQRYEIASLHEKNGNLAANLKSRDAYITKIESHLQDLNEKIKQLEEKRDRDSRNLKRMEKSKALAQKEAEFLREQLKSYDMEEVTMMPGSFDSAKATRISQLEELVEEYRQQIKQLEENNESGRANATSEESGNDNTTIAALRERLNELVHDNEQHQEVLANLKKENGMLVKENESLDKQLGALEFALGRGEYNPSKTRVLQLIDNPTSREVNIRASTLDSLKAENKQLLQKIQELQTTRPNPAAKATTEDSDMIPYQSYANLQNENRRLEDQVAEKEKRMMRLKEVWKAKAQEYREAVYSLLGYKFDFLENGRVRLSSIYASQDDHSFIFTSGDNDSGTMQLIGGGNTEYMRSLHNMIQFWVVERGSIPAFLSSVTLELFDKIQ